MYALYPFPERSAGDRLATIILGLTRAEYLRRFDRVNLCTGKWSMAEARKVAHSIRRDGGLFPGGERTVVLLGRKVASAFGLDSRAPFSVVKDFHTFDDVIHTGSPAVAEKLPAWEANSRVVLAGAKRWALKRWGRS